MFFGAVGEAAVGRAEGDVAVSTAGAPRDGGALHFLDSGDAGEGPEVGVGYPRELFCGRVSDWWGTGEGRRDGLRTFDWVEEVTSGFQTGVGAVVAFGGETHGGAVGTAGVGESVVAGRWISCCGRLEVEIWHLRSTAMPRQPQKHWAVAAIIIIVLLLEQLGDKIIHLLIVILCRCEHASCLARASLLQLGDAAIVEIEVSCTTRCKESNNGDIEASV